MCTLSIDLCTKILNEQYRAKKNTRCSRNSRTYWKKSKKNKIKVNIAKCIGNVNNNGNRQGTLQEEKVGEESSNLKPTKSQFLGNHWMARRGTFKWD